MTKSDGSVIFVNYDELSSRPPADIERLLAHEAGHVLIDSRATEETSGHRYSSETDWQWLLKCLGAQAIVEFRIERSLAELGYPASESTVLSSVEDSLLITNVEVVNAVLDPASADPGHLRDAVVTTLNHATKTLAYIAAPLIVSGTAFPLSQLSAEGQANWRDYIAPTWTRRIAFWTAIPSAAEAIPVKDWRAILHKSAELEQALLLNFGFAFEDAAHGGYAFYRKSAENVFIQRLNRARTQTDMLSG